MPTTTHLVAAPSVRVKPNNQRILDILRFSLPLSLLHARWLLYSYWHIVIVEGRFPEHRWTAVSPACQLRLPAPKGPTRRHDFQCASLQHRAYGSVFKQHQQVYSIPDHLVKSPRFIRLRAPAYAREAGQARKPCRRGPPPAHRAGATRKGARDSARSSPTQTSRPGFSEEHPGWHSHIPPLLHRLDGTLSSVVQAQKAQKR